MKAAFLGLSLMLSWTAAASANTYFLRPDGTGDFPTIQAAVQVAVDGDIILLDDGIFSGPGNRDVDLQGKSLDIHSASDNPRMCTLDCDGSASDHHFAFLQWDAGLGETSIEAIRIVDALCGDAAISIYNEATVRITRCLFENNQGGWAGAILCAYSAAIIEDCVFVGNRGEAGGGVACYQSSPTIRNCTFQENSSTVCGGAIDTHYYAGPEIAGCVFVRNRSDGDGGAVRCGYNTSTRISNCTFVANEALWGGGVSCYQGASPTVTSCTFYQNSASRGSGLYCGDQTSARLGNCLIAGGYEDAAVSCVEGSVPAIGCSDIYGNEGGDWVECIEKQFGMDGNISADPLFCDPANGEYTLHANSPCLPGNHPDGVDCGLIGALEEGCGPTRTLASTWGRIKASFR